MYHRYANFTCSQGATYSYTYYNKKIKDNGLNVDSVLLGEQMRVISEKRIIKKIGTVTDEIERNEIRRVYEANFGE